MAEPKRPVITYGADPELFIVRRDMTALPASGYLQGGKGSPHLIHTRGLPKGWGILPDGAALEINTPAYTDPVLFAMDLRRFIRGLGSQIMPHTLAYGQTTGVNMVELNPQQNFFQSIGRQRSYTFLPHSTFSDYDLRHPACQQLGCAPDHWIYGERKPVKVDEIKNERFAGGHLHIGLDPWPENLPKDAMIRLLDLTAYYYYTSQALESNRLKYYGYPGLWRETKYGVEYRSLGPEWISRAEQMMVLVDFMVRRVVDFCGKGGEIEEVVKYIETLNLWPDPNTPQKAPQTRRGLTSSGGITRKTVMTKVAQAVMPFVGKDVFSRCTVAEGYAPGVLSF
jgi:hypothetical protein